MSIKWVKGWKWFHRNAMCLFYGSFILCVLHELIFGNSSNISASTKKIIIFFTKNLPILRNVNNGKFFHWLTLNFCVTFVIITIESLTKKKTHTNLFGLTGFAYGLVYLFISNWNYEKVHNVLLRTVILNSLALYHYETKVSTHVPSFRILKNCSLDLYITSLLNKSFVL